jgi:ligand-binding sensor domain-containing protein
MAARRSARAFSKIAVSSIIRADALEAPEITAIAHDPAGAHWVGTPNGVYAFVTRAGSWELQPAGLEGRRVTALTVHPDGYLLAAVAGSGTFRARLR